MPLTNRSTDAAPYWLAGLVLGLLPTVSGLLFRTYSYHVAPDWYEQLRQFDALFVLFELGAIVVARTRGMDYAKLAGRLGRPERIALCVCLGTFWISSVFVSQFPAASSLRIVIWFVHIAFACAVFHLARSITQEGIDHFAKACFLGLCTYVPVLAIHFALAPDPASLPGRAIIWSSAVPGYLSVRLFGFTAAALALLAIGLLWSRRRFAPGDWWLYGGLVLSLTLTLWSGTRGGIYAIALATCALPFVARARPHPFWLAATALGALGAMALSQFAYQPDGTFGLINLTSGEGDAGFTNGRYEIWLRSVELIEQRPLLGWGESAISWLLENNNGHQQPHNALLQILLSWGAIASAAAVYLGFRALEVVVRNAHRTRMLATPVTVLIGLLIMSTVDGILYNPRTTILAIVAAGGGLAIALRKESATADGNSEPEGMHTFVPGAARRASDFGRLEVHAGLGQAPIHMGDKID